MNTENFVKKEDTENFVEYRKLKKNTEKFGNKQNMEVWLIQKSLVKKRKRKSLVNSENFGKYRKVWKREYGNVWYKRGNGKVW